MYGVHCSAAHFCTPEGGEGRGREERGREGRGMGWMFVTPTAVSEHNVHFIFVHTRHQGGGV